MLDAYVINEIKRRDQGRETDRRPAVEIHPPPPPPAAPEKPSDDADRDRGVVIVDYTGN